MDNVEGTENTFITTEVGNDTEHRKYFNILDGLTEHRADRAQILLKNLVNEDLVHIDPQKIPAFLRIDKDIKKRHDALKQCHKEYMEFDIQDMDRNARIKLRDDIAVASTDFKARQQKGSKLLLQSEAKNSDSYEKHQEIVGMRVKQNQKISEALAESHSQLKDFERQNNENDRLRVKLAQMQRNLRDINVKIQRDKLNYEKLSAKVDTEKSLRKERDSKEQYLLTKASAIQEQSINWTDSALKHTKEQIDHVQQKKNQLQDNMQKRQNLNYQELVDAIEKDMLDNRDEIKELNDHLRVIDGQYQRFKLENQRIATQNSQISDSFIAIQKKESDAQTEFENTANAINEKLQEQNDLIQDNVNRLSEAQADYSKLRNDADSLQIKIDIGQQQLEYHEINAAEAKLKNLQAEIAKSQQAMKSLETEIASTQTKWVSQYKEAQKQMKGKIDHTMSQTTKQQIVVLFKQVQDIETENGKIHAEVQDLLQNQKTKIDDNQLEDLKNTVNLKVKEYKLRLNKKAALFEEMYTKALLLINRDAQIIENQQEIIHLKHEIDVNILEVEQKAVKIKDLQDILVVRKETYKKLKKEIKEIEEQCEELQIILKEKEDYFETLEDVLRDKDIIIEGLEKTLGERAPVLTDADRAKKPKEKLYQADQGDQVDELLARYINEFQIDVPVRKDKPGFYVFGTKKINAKVMNNKLVVRVGGGHMTFAEFWEKYNQNEGQPALNVGAY